MGTASEVFNQPPPLEGYNVYAADAVLREAVEREGAAWAVPSLLDVGRVAGSAEAIEWGFQANRHPPELRTHDRFGHRIDEVAFHPAWHRLLGEAVERGMHAAPWADPTPGAHVARAAAFLVWSQVESGVGCPVSMTYAAVPALRVQPELARAWEPLLASCTYDPGLRPPLGKGGVLCGMAMTERQGGSDVRANTTAAVPAGGGGPGGEYLVTGHKWFCSAPMCDAFLVLAQAPDGLSCFLLPRVLPDGGRNAFHIERLKDKLGNRSNASSEIELVDAHAWMVGGEGQGVRTIVEMVNCTRLDCILGTAALMRQAVAQATHHAAHRSAFGRRLADQPLMRNVLADLAVESEAATTLAMRLAGACDRSAGGVGSLSGPAGTAGTAGLPGSSRREVPSASRDSDGHEAALKRIGTALGKYWVCKRGPALTAEALECLGGNGYVEEAITPRLYREAPLNSIWEGSGNVNALDVVRAITRSPGTVDALFAEVDLGAGADRRLDAFAAALRSDVHGVLGDSGDPAPGARRLAERMALALQGALLVRHAPPAVADAFCASRLAGDWGFAFGTLPSTVDTRAIVDRHTPAGASAPVSAEQALDPARSQA